MTAVVAPMDTLRYLSKADPLERRVTFDDLQARPLSWQSAMPRDPVAEQVNSLQFKSMEGQMFENAKAAAQTVNLEKMKEVAASHVATSQEIPYNLAEHLVSPTPSLASLYAGIGVPHQEQRTAEEATARNEEALTMHSDQASQNAAALLHAPSHPHVPVLNLLQGVDGAGQYLPAPGGPASSSPSYSPRQYAEAMQTWMSSQMARGPAGIPGVQRAQDLMAGPLAPSNLVSRIGASAPSMAIPNVNLQGYLQSPSVQMGAGVAGLLAAANMGGGIGLTSAAMDSLLYGGAAASGTALVQRMRGDPQSPGRLLERPWERPFP